MAPADEDVALLRQALIPAGQATTFFAVIASLLGLLFAFNAMLLTVPDRRQAIADLRIDGAKRSAIVAMVLFEGLCLGAVASVIGLAIGYALSVSVFHESPGYLAQTFVLGEGTVIGAAPVLLALAAGIVAVALASALPLLDLRRRRAVDAVYFEDGTPGNALSRRVQRRLFLAALCLVVPATLLFVLVPSAAIVSVGLLAIATVLAVRSRSRSSRESRHRAGARSGCHDVAGRAERDARDDGPLARARGDGSDRAVRNGRARWRARRSARVAAVVRERIFGRGGSVGDEPARHRRRCDVLTRRVPARIARTPGVTGVQPSSRSS